MSMVLLEQTGANGHPKSNFHLKLFSQVDSKVLDDIASGCPHASNMSLLKYWCETETVPLNHSAPPIYPHMVEGTTKEIGISECKW